MCDLSAPDRAWLVAGLTLAGLTAKDIADRLGCSLRLVRSVRAEPSTQVCLIAQIESRNFADELRLEKSEHQVTRRERDELQAERDRIKRQVDNLLDARMIGEPISTCRQCGHPLDKYNTYQHAKTGKRRCRNCHRELMATRRAAGRLGVTVSEYRLSQLPQLECPLVS
jgi:hypothetical protein